MRKSIFIMGLLIFVVLISACTSQLGPKIELSTSSFDLGDINPDEGIRTETFYVKNTGDSLLTISSVSTSCGCTEAEVKSTEILPGEKTELTINYDPSVHPGLEGKIKRIVYIQSNDPTQEEIELELIGNSLKSSKEHVEGDEHEESEHSEEATGHDDDLNDFEISPFQLYSKIKNKDSFKLLDVREDFEYEENHIDGTLLLSVNKINQAELDKLGLKKDDEIVVYCRSGRRSTEAYEILKSLGYTNVKSMDGGIIHWMEENLPVESGTSASMDTSNSPSDDSAPFITFDRLEHDFGDFPQYGGIINTTFTVTNTGASDLKITSVSTSCGCTKAELEELVISSGESSLLTVFFDPNFHEEPKDRFSRTVFLETNDPTTPEAELKIWIDILEGQ